MGRKYIDCRDYPSDIKCSLTLTADTEEELLDAAMQHGIAVHGFKDTPGLRNELRKDLKEGAPRP